MPWKEAVTKWRKTKDLGETNTWVEEETVKPHPFVSGDPGWKRYTMEALEKGLRDLEAQTLHQCTDNTALLGRKPLRI